MTSADEPRHLSNGVRRLLLERVDSIEKLDILLLLRAHAGEACTPAAIGERLQISPETVNEGLDQLRSSRLVAQARDRVSFRYAPQDPDLEAAVDELAHFYQHGWPAIARLFHPDD
jgi:DNA-binding IclR family transcriptional regulator